eukprot:6194348-Pleurochrysis_carterae.AAC.2
MQTTYGACASSAIGAAHCSSSTASPLALAGQARLQTLHHRKGCKGVTAVFQLHANCLRASMRASRRISCVSARCVTRQMYDMPHANLEWPCKCSEEVDALTVGDDCLLSAIRRSSAFVAPVCA